jgi:Fungal specific transcription factor domain
VNPEAWLDFVKTDPAPLHAFLSIIASLLNLVRELDNSTWIDYHKGQSIQIVNQRLDEEGRSTRISDGVIAAVTMMTIMESITGCFEAANAHMNGLKRMVEIRGGLTAGFDHSTLLQRVLTW